MAWTTAAKPHTPSTLRWVPAKLVAPESSPIALDRTAQGALPGHNACSAASAAGSPQAVALTCSEQSAKPAGTGSPARIAAPSWAVLPPKAAASVASANGWIIWLSSQQRDLARLTVDSYPCPVGNYPGGLTRADDPRDAVLAGDDGSMAQLTATVGHNRAQQRKHDVEVWRRHAGNEDVAVLDAREVGVDIDDPRPALVRSSVDG